MAMQPGVPQPFASTLYKNINCPGHNRPLSTKTIVLCLPLNIKAYGHFFLKRFTKKELLKILNEVRPESETLLGLLLCLNLI
ncbi:hypothetical protein, partial [Lactobacillus helveticus]